MGSAEAAAHVIAGSWSMRRAGELSAEELEQLMTIVANPRQYKIPDWFLNRCVCDQVDALAGGQWTLQRAVRTTVQEGSSAVLLSPDPSHPPAVAWLAV